MPDKNKENILLSIVIPIYCEADHIENTISFIRTTIHGISASAEFILVDDGSTDNSWAVLEDMASRYPDVKALRFSRNFGKECAILSGLRHSSGDAVVVMDADLQHPPSLIPKMFELWKNNEGIKVVHAVKTHRGEEGYVSRMTSGLFYMLYQKLAGMNLKNASDFKLLDREIVNIYCNFKERNLFFRGIIPWLGFDSASVVFEVQERISGTTKWSSLGLYKMAISALISFSTIPLQLVTLIGALFLLASVILIATTLSSWFSGNAVEGFTTVIILLLVIGSVLMISLGIIGQYLAKMYQEIKQRPNYLIKTKNGFSEESRSHENV